MTTATNRRRIKGWLTRATTFGLLALAAVLYTATETRAQWVTDKNGTSITGNVGVGTTTPQTSLHVSTASTAVPRGITNEQTSADGNAALYVFRKSRAGAAAVNGDNIGNVYAQAFDGASFISGGRLRFAVDGPVAVGSVPTSLQFFTGAGGDGFERMRISSSGFIGIGTASPGRALDVQGGQGQLRLTSTSNGFGSVVELKSTAATPSMLGAINFVNAADLARGQIAYTAGDVLTFNTGSVERMRLDAAGNLTVTGNINAKYQDVAEWVPSTQKLAAGTVVILDGQRSNQVLASVSAYDTSVAGVISAQPGIALGEAGEGKVLVATTGRVKVRVDATRGAIRVGDLLVTSDREGYAMKSEPVMVGNRKMHSPGTIVGKALEPLAGGTREILVLLSLQ